MESESQARVELEQTKELLNQSCAELKTIRELESLAQKQCEKAQVELESIILNSTYPFSLFFSSG